MEPAKPADGTHINHLETSASDRPVVTLAIEESGREKHVSFRLIILTAAIAGVYLATIVHIVGSGLLARSIAATVGGSDKVAWLTIVVTIHPILLGPPVAQAADLWGRKWLVVGCMLAGTVGCIIVSRSN